MKAVGKLLQVVGVGALDEGVGGVASTTEASAISSTENSSWFVSPVDVASGDDRCAQSLGHWACE